MGINNDCVTNAHIGEVGSPPEVPMSECGTLRVKRRGPSEYTI